MLRPIDRNRWLAVSRAQRLVEAEGGSIHGVSDEDALCTYIMWAKEQPDDPAARWYHAKPSKTQRAAWKRDWDNLCP